ncbi:MAG: gliding motility-associated C-terminal domain-containing protein, partial [Bacteroidia bacterium]|nr:gliding motility-associated C-terminal domain-containing protein [Bacteroidia bacterium]
MFQNHFKFVVITLLVLFNSVSLYAQNFKWLKSFGVKAYSETSWLSVPEPDGGLTFILKWSQGLNLPQDTLLIDTFKFIYKFKSGHGYPSCLVRLDSNGNVLRAKYLGTARFTAFCKDDLGNYYIGSDILESLNIIGNDTLDLQRGSLVCSKFDKNFNHIWSSQTGGDTAGRSFTKFKFSNGKLLFIANLYKNSIIGKDTYNLIYQWVHIFGELDTSAGRVLWSQLYFQRKIGAGGFWLADILRMPSGSLYLVGYTWEEDYVKNGDSFNRYSGFVIKTDSIGNYQKRLLLRGGYNFRTYDPHYPHSIYQIDNIDSTLIIAGYMGNDIFWGGKKITKSLDSGFLGYEGFIASLSEDLKEGFFYKPDFVSAGKWFGSSHIYNFLTFSFAINHGSIYALGSTSYSLQADSLQVLVDTSQLFPYGSFLLKIDLNGSVIWGRDFEIDSQAYYDWGGWGFFGGNGWSQNFISSTTNAVYLSAPYKYKVDFPPHSAKPKGEYDVFVLKIVDNIIHRGPVSKGPYCAGDTFLIPFTKEGIFEDLNYFIAELSNEKGEFDANTRRLGVLRGNNDSTIRAVLPLKNVVSSYNYKIRIRATRPYCTNDFVSDTLRLTIYSKDPADAGRDSLMCPSDSIQLFAKGGTHVEWWEYGGAKFSNTRKTFVVPKNNTRYMAIVSDSSGCSVKDTAFKWVFLPLNTIELNSRDTIICVDNTLPLTAKFIGPDSTKFKWQWWLTEFGFDNIIKTGQSKSTDKLNFKFDFGYSVKVKIMLDNGCKNALDTVVINVSIPTDLKITNKNTAILACMGQPLVLTGIGSGGIKPHYQFQWFDADLNSLLKKGDTLNMKTNSKKNLLLTLMDGCMEKADSLKFVIDVKPKLKVSGNLKDTVLCYGQQLAYTASGTGGQSTQYQFDWILDGKNIGNGAAFHLATEKHFGDAGGIKKIQLVLFDNCTEKNDTISAKIQVKARITTKVNYDSLLCFGSSQKLSANATGGDGKKTFRWYDPNGNLLSQLDTIIVANKNKNVTGIQRYFIIANDGCSVPDTQFIVFNFLTPLQAKIQATDSCLHASTVLTASPSGGLAPYHYSWFLNTQYVGQTASIAVPKPAEEVAYKLVVKDACFIDSSIAVQRVSPYPQVELLSNVDSGCEPLNVRLHVLKLNGTNNEYQYTWAAGNSTNWVVDTFATSRLLAGNFIPMLEVRNQLGCMDTAFSHPILVHPKPQSKYTYTPNKPTPQSPEIQFVNSSTGATRFNWNFGKFGNSTVANPKVTIPESGVHIVSLIAINQFGCSDTNTGTIRIYDDYQLWLPTAFTPGLDNLNPVFKPEFSGVDSYTLYIYNRHGLLIFIGENQGWDGIYKNNRVPEGMYVYVLKINTTSKMVREEKGTLML